MSLLISFLDYTVPAHRPERDKKQVVMKAAQNQTVPIIKAATWLIAKTFLLNNLMFDHKNPSSCLSAL